jgi:hypothetical protein
MEYSKVGDKLQESETVTRVYSYKDLLFKKQMYEEQIETTQKMLDKVNVMIAEAEKLGLKK